MVRKERNDGPLTARQLVTIIVVLAALVGGFFFLRSAIRYERANTRVTNCMANSEPGYAQFCK